MARLALIIAEFQCDVLYRGQKEALAEFLPLDGHNWITRGNALRLDWLSICPPTGIGVKLQADDLFATPLEQGQIDFENEGGETYICGNPPYKGSQAQTVEQKADLKFVFDDHQKRWPSLDYIAGWFFKAGLFLNVTNGEAGFVSTNSISQGEQIPLLWPLLLKLGHSINFCHTSFNWSNLASRNAGVTVVVIGFGKGGVGRKRIYESTEAGDINVREVSNINPYLVASDNVLVQAVSRQPRDRWLMLKGNDTLKAIAASLLMEQVLAPRFNFTPKNPNGGPIEGFNYGEGGYDPNKCNVGFNEETGQFRIEIKGLAGPKSKEAIHRVFDPARLDIEIKDRFGHPVVPREWFLVPLFVIDEAVEKIRNETIANFRYDPKSASLVDARP